MSTVKGSKQDRLMVISYNPVYLWLRRIGLVIFSVVVVAGSYQLGHIKGLDTQVTAVAENERLKSLLNQRNQQAEDLRVKIATLGQDSQVGEKTSENVRQIIKALEDQVFELQKKNSFYKGIMAPTANDKGLRIQKLDMIATSDPYRFRYKIVLTQVADNKGFIQGLVAVNFKGTQNGQQVVLPLRDISRATEFGEKFRFRYFQDFSGELVLPEGFMPEMIEIVAQSSGSKSMRIEENYQWSVQENLAHVEQG